MAVLKGISSVNASFSLSLHYLFFTSLCNLIAFVYGCTTKKQRKGHISDTVLKTRTKHSIQASYVLEFYTEDIHTIF